MWWTVLSTNRQKWSTAQQSHQRLSPMKEGYTFSGWSEIPETMPAQDVTVTGSFTINKYKLTYMVDGAEYKSYEIEFGAKSRQRRHL